MNKLDVDLPAYLKGSSGIDRYIKIVSVISKVIDILEIVHHSNVIFNDMKPDNIMVNRKTGAVTLIDFGFASPYLNKDGTHIQDNETNEDFHGNIIFASYDQMNFFKTSRKDDIISIFYMLFTLLNNNCPIGKEKDVAKLFENEDDVALQFKAYREYKEKYTITNIVKYITKNKLLNPFGEDSSNSELY